MSPCIEGSNASGSISEFLRTTYCIVSPRHAKRSRSERHPFHPGSVSLGAAHLPLEALTFAGNPNLGAATTAADVREGLARLKETLGPYVPIPFACVHEGLWPMEDDSIPLVPISLYFTYPWEQFFET